MSTTTPFLIRSSIISFLRDRHEFAELLKRSDSLGELAVMIHYGTSAHNGVRIAADLDMLDILRQLSYEIEAERADRISSGVYDDRDRSTALLLADARRTALTLRKDVAKAIDNLLTANGL